MKQLLSFIVLLFLAAPGVVSAFEPGRVSLPVPDRGAEQRSEALREGLRRVLVRLTGMRDPSDSPAVAALLDADPARWVLQYSYAEPEEVEDGDQREGDSESVLQLSASYDVTGLSKRLARAGAPVWGTDRPAVLLWVVDQGAARGEFIGRDERGDVAKILRQTAGERGLPVIMPQLDGTDRARVQPADVRGRFDGPVTEASERYDAALVLTAVLYRGTSPRLRWRLLEQGRQVREGDLVDGDPEALLSGLIHRVTDYVANLYAVRGGSARSVSLRIRELSELADWKQARDHLASMSGMEALHVERLDGTTATFLGQFAGNIDQLERLVRLLPTMETCSGLDAGQADVSMPQPSPDAEVKQMELEFCWSHED